MVLFTGLLVGMWQTMNKKIIALLFLIVSIIPINIKAKTISCYKLVDMGDFKLTAYCPCEKCSQGHGYKTSTDKTAQEGKTIAVDPDVISYGSKVLIGDTVYIAEDCGTDVKGDHIDIFMENHEATKKFGIKHAHVDIIQGDYEY